MEWITSSSAKGEDKTALQRALKKKLSSWKVSVKK